MNAIHINTMHELLTHLEPVDISLFTSKGEVQHYKNCISQRYDFLQRYTLAQVVHIWTSPPSARCVHLPNQQIWRCFVTYIARKSDFYDKNAHLHKFICFIRGILVILRLNSKKRIYDT